MTDSARADALRRFERRMRRRLDVRVATLRVTSAVPAVVQIVLGVMASYSIARFLVGHPSPLLSVTVVISALGLGRDARPRRVLESTIGILVGIILSELLLMVVGHGLWQVAFVLLVTLLVARAVSPSNAFAVAAGVQSMLVMLTPIPVGGPFARSLDGLIGGVVALLVTALVPRDPRRAAIRDGAALASALYEAMGSLVDGLRDGTEPAANLAVERLRRTQSLVDNWTASLESALSVARISPFLRRHLPALRAHARLLRGFDYAARHLRVIARRAFFLLASGGAEPEIAALLERVAEAVRLLGESLQHPERRAEAQLLLVELAPELDPAALLPSAPVTESVMVLLIRPLAVDLLVATGMDADEARALLPQV